MSELKPDAIEEGYGKFYRERMGKFTSTLDFFKAGCALGNESLSQEIRRLEALINSPELNDFAKGVALEAVHQRERWGEKHDAEKSPEDWYWVVGYLSGKALRACIEGDKEKSLHHIITTAAVLNNWHAQLIAKCAADSDTT